MKEDDLQVLNNTAVISIDNADIFTVSGLSLKRITENENILSERQDNEDFVLEWNKTWGLSIDLFRAVFPYEHNFAEAVQNEFVSVFKWLKILHKKKTASSVNPLPNDLYIKVSCSLGIKCVESLCLVRVN